MKTSHLLRAALCGILLTACSSTGKKQYAGVDDSDIISDSPLPERNEGVSFMGGNVERTRFPAVHFAFDSYSVDPDDFGTLNEIASFMKGSNKQLIIAGFTDERGTAEYNRGLGERRAQAVRSYLLRKGVSSAFMQTTSFGAEMPVDERSNEAAWAKNRRAEFGLTK